ncbi:MAG: DUF4138 domain-containing protein [Pricia sp.]
MRIVSTILPVLIAFQINAQDARTLYTNEKQVVGLFFPGSIRQAVVGSEDFTFSYNRENPHQVGLLQGNPGSKSNLLVITENGDVFSYLLAYRKKLDTLIHFVPPKERIGTERPLAEAIDEVDFPKLSVAYQRTGSSNPAVDYRMEYFEKFSDYQLENNKNKLKQNRKDGLIIRLKDLIYDRTEVYAVMEIKNRSGIDFETDYLKIFNVNGNNRRKASYQKLILEPLLAYKLPAIIKDGEKASFVMVLQKFTFGDSEKLLFELKDQNGSRVIDLRYN